MKKLCLIILFSFVFTANSYAEGDCSRYVEQINNIRISIIDLKDQYNQIGEKIDNMRKSIRSQYPSMPENSLLTYIRSRSTSLVESYDNLAIQISTKESEISQLRLIYQDCTTLKSETNYNEISQQNEVRKKALEEKEKLAKMDAYYAEKAKEATEALQKQIVKEEKLRKAKASQENRKARIEQNKKRLSEIREKRKIQ